MGNPTKLRVLLDTHIWVWYLLGDDRLSRKHRQLIEDEVTELWLSPLSVWEAHLLIEKGRLPVREPAGDWIRLALQTLHIREAPITFAVAIRSRSIELSHEDPADRFIAATAAEMNLVLFTADERLRTSHECRSM